MCYSLNLYKCTFKGVNADSMYYLIFPIFPFFTDNTLGCVESNVPVNLHSSDANSLRAIRRDHLLSSFRVIHSSSLLQSLLDLRLRCFRFLDEISARKFQRFSLYFRLHFYNSVHVECILTYLFHYIPF